MKSRKGASGRSGVFLKESRFFTHNTSLLFSCYYLSMIILADETAKTANRLQKSGKKDKNFGYDPSDGDSDGDDHDEVAEEFNFDTWEWEFVDEESEDQMHKSSSSEMNAGSDPKPMASQNSVGGMMGRMDEISDEGQFTFSSNFLSNMDFQPVGNGEPVNSNFLSNTDFQPVGNGELVSSNFLDFQPVGNGESVSSNFLDFQPVGNGEPVGRPAPMAIMSNKLGKFRFNFPTIQHTVYSGPINLKAHSSIDLSAMDPEIFDVVQSILTPYLQLTIGDPLNAYNLEIDYAPRYDESVGDDVVTLMEVKCTFKVVSDSIESFLNTNHDEARLWIKDFFTGPSGYNVKKLIESLQSNNIPVDDIVFVNEKFDMGNTVSQANSQSFGNTPSSLNKTGENSRRGISGIAMVCVTLSVLFVGILFFMHSTGRLPSKTEIGEFSLNTRDSVKHHSINARDSIRKCMPTSIQLGKKRKGGDDSEGGGRRRRTFSGTFRRFPTGGLQKAAIQKKGAKSEQYIGDSESTSHKLSKFEDYSFSHYGGDYGPSTPSRQSSIPPMTPMSRRSVDEFGMPDTYDSLHDKSRSDRESLLGRVGKTASYLMSPKQKSNYSTKSPVPSRASRRVTAADIASPDDVDNWSIDSYESSEKSSASDDLLYRGWNESGPEMRRPIPSDPPASRREKLSLPFFK